jgi:hypothetical protein
MKNLFLFHPLLVLLILFQGLAWGQNSEDVVKKGYGYVFATPGAAVSNGSAASTLTIGGGGEGLLRGGLGVGVDVGYLFFTQHGIREGFGLFSPGAFYQFRRSQKVVPFVGGGYSLAFRSDVLNMVHFGGGFNYWPKNRWGLRFEVRDHLAPSSPDLNLIEFRIGLLFR